MGDKMPVDAPSLTGGFEATRTHGASHRRARLDWCEVNRRLSLVLELAGLGDLDLGLRLVAAIGLLALDLAHDLHRVLADHLTEHNVLTVEPRRGDSGDEELRTVGVLASVGHGQQALLRVLELEVLVGEFLAVDALAAGAVTVREVAALEHEVLDDAVEGRALVAEALLASGKRTEVLGRLRHALAVQPHHDAACTWGARQ